MNTVAAQAPILAWLSGLADLTRAASDDKPTPARLRLYSQMLGDFPRGVFSAASLQAIASAGEFFPAIGPLRERLAGWWSEHNPAKKIEAPPAPPAPDPAIVSTLRWFSTWPNEDDYAAWMRRRMLYLEREAWMDSLTLDERMAISAWILEGTWGAIAAQVIAEHPASAFYGCRAHG